MGYPIVFSHLLFGTICDRKPSSISSISNNAPAGTTMGFHEAKSMAVPPNVILLTEPHGSLIQESPYSVEEHNQMHNTCRYFLEEEVSTSVVRVLEIRSSMR